MNGFTISLILTGVFLIVTLLGTVNGITRGVGRQAIRITTVIASLIFAFFMTLSGSSILSKFCVDKSLGEALMSVELHRYFNKETMDVLFCFDAETAEQLLALPFKTVLLPFVFSALFFIIALFTLLVYLTMCKLFCAPGGRMSKLSRTLGAVLGAVQGVIMATVLILPVLGVADLAADTNARFLEKHDGNVEGNAFCEIYDSYIDDVNANPLFGFINTVATEPICNGLATAEIEGERVNLRDTASQIIVTSEDLIPLGEFNWADPTPEERGELRRIVTSLSDDTYVSSVLAGTLRGIATALDKGIIDMKFEEPALGLIKGIMQVFTTLDAENLSLDIRTVLDVYDLLVEEQVITAMSEGGTDGVATALIAKDAEGKTVIRRIIAKIEENEHMKSLVTVFTKLSLSIMMDNIGVDNGAEIYESIKEGLAAVIAIDKDAYGSDEEYRAAVSSALDTTLKAHDIDLHPDIVGGMSDYVVENLSDVDEITDDEIYATIFSYYDAYSEHIGEAEILP